MKKKVAVAISGGVDSSLTAKILLECGFDVLGITMKLNSDEKNILDAQKVCNHLGISHHVADFKEI